jgi:hypothetical protein
VTSALKPSASCADTTSVTNTPNDDAIVLFGCIVGFKPLNTGSEGEHFDLINKRKKAGL